MQKSFIKSLKSMKSPSRKLFGSYRRWFTLIEIMISLMGFGVGMIVLLRAIVYFIGAGDEVKKKAQATLMAKEAMDIVYNQRDTNLRRGVIWKCARINIRAAGDACDIIFTPGKTYTVGFDWWTWYVINELQSWTGANQSSANIALYGQNVWDIWFYTYDNTGTPSFFRREVLVSDATLQDNRLSSDQVVKITVKVYYLPNDINRAVILESYLSAWEKTQ